MSQTPSKGRTVRYILDEGDCEHINRKRKEALDNAQANRDARNGVQVHVGNTVFPGDDCSAVITRVLEGRGEGQVNLQVTLDGNDAYWATARREGTERATWHWPNVDIAGRTPAEKEALRST